MKINFDDIDQDEALAPPAWGLDETLINRIKLGFFGVIITGCFGIGLAQTFSPQARAIRSEIQTQDKEQSRQLSIAEQQARHGEQSRRIAEQRYQDGCLLVRLNDERGNAISLFEGLIVVDKITQQPLASGTAVCDPNGATSILESGGKVGSVASTPDLKMISELIQQGVIR